MWWTSLNRSRHLYSSVKVCVNPAGYCNSCTIYKDIQQKNSTTAADHPITRDKCEESWYNTKIYCFDPLIVFYNELTLCLIVIQEGTQPFVSKWPPNPSSQSPFRFFAIPCDIMDARNQQSRWIHMICPFGPRAMYYAYDLIDTERTKVAHSLNTPLNLESTSTTDLSVELLTKIAVGALTPLKS